MDNKAQAGNYAIAFMLAVCLVLCGIAWASSINEVTKMAMNETSSFGGMNCTGTTNEFVKAGCLVTDIGQFYFIGGILALAGLIIVARVIFAG